MASTLFDKIWNEHTIFTREDGNTLLYVDRHLIHDLHFRLFDQLKAEGHSIREPDKLFGVPDHSLPTTAKSLADIPEGEMREAVEVLERASEEHNFTHFSMTDDRHGIVHVIGPEQGITQPGLLLACGDSHTSTHGALGCIALGIGSTEVKHLLATQTLWQRKPKTMRITINGELGFGVTAKDVILAVIREIGTAGGTGYAIEYAGPIIETMSMEGRMTVCNMTIEAGSRFGLIAPDDKTIAYVHGRPYAPEGAEWSKAEEYWRTLKSDDDAAFDKEIVIDGNAIAPMVTWGNSPQWALPITDAVPDPADEPDESLRATMAAAIDYMDIQPGLALSDIAVDMVFIGSCTNARIEDMRAAAEVVKGRKKAANVERALVVPGSGLVKRQAEEEGLDQIFINAGLEWRSPGCSMCLAMNADRLEPGKRCASTSNRNFEGRQGAGGRTHLVSPAMAAAAAIAGHFVNPAQLEAVS